MSYLISSLASHSFNPRFHFHSLIFSLRSSRSRCFLGRALQQTRPTIAQKKFTCSLVATVPDGRRGIKWKTGGCDRPLAKKGREEAVVAAFLVCQSVQACTSRQSRSRHHQTTNPVRSGPFRSTVFKLSTNRLSPVDQVKPNPALRPSAPNGPLLLSSSRLVIFRFFFILPIRVFIFFASLQQIIHFTFERLDQ